MATRTRVLSWNQLAALFLGALAVIAAGSNALGASVVGTNASLTLTQQVPSQWVTLGANTLGWEVIYQPVWLDIYPEPTTMVVGQRTARILPPTSIVLAAVDADIDPGRYSDRLVLQDLGTGGYYEAQVGAIMEDPATTAETARLIVYTNTSRALDLNLDINTGAAGKYYVLMDHEQLLPGQVYAYVPQGKLVLFSSFGFPTADAEGLYLAEGVSTVSLMLGEFPLRGLEGTLHVAVDRSTSTGLIPVQEIFYDVASLSGDWEVFDTFDGVSYPSYSAEIHEGFSLFSGRWMGYPVEGSYSVDGAYVLQFSDGGYDYQYVISALGKNFMSGFWSYSGSPGKVHPFMAQKRSGFFPVSGQINGEWTLASQEDSCCCAPPGLFDGPTVLTRNGDQLTVGIERGDLIGTITGNRLRLSGVFPEETGTLSVIASGTVTQDGCRLYGTGHWTWVSPEMSCEGISIFHGSR